MSCPSYSGIPNICAIVKVSISRFKTAWHSKGNTLCLRHDRLKFWQYLQILGWIVGNTFCPKKQITWWLSLVAFSVIHCNDLVWNEVFKISNFLCEKTAPPGIYIHIIPFSEMGIKCLINNNFVIEIYQTCFTLKAFWVFHESFKNCVSIIQFAKVLSLLWIVTSPLTLQSIP